MQDFSVTITPRFYETDAMGHINNATLAAWFEVARVRYIEALAGDGAAVGRDWILATITVDFLDETFYGSDVELRIVDASIGNTSLTVFCEMWQDNRLTVKGKAVVVHIDYDAKQPRRVPDAMRRRLSP
ncbi:MAG: acyl-CoA thioesterase [Gammaproteobacteria bacterium]|jgi:acyl-CoA thioester hydrolase|nr:acyl-CoA thioesterase [Gammaproteobacteria bacterium]